MELPIFLTVDQVLRIQTYQIELNGYSLDIPVDQAEQLVLGVATGRIDKAAVSAKFRTWRRGP